MVRIGEVIHTLLMSDEKLSSTLTGVYPVIADFGDSNQVTYPFCIYKRTGVEVTNTTNLYGDEWLIDMDITIVTDNYADGVDIIERVIQTLNHRRYNTSDGKYHIEDILIQNASENYNQFGYTQEISIRVTVN